MSRGDVMLVEAYVRRKINDFTFECIVAINRYYTRQQQIQLYPLRKKNGSQLNIDDILHRAIYIWKHPYFEKESNYLGKIIYRSENKIFVINQGIEEIFKKIE